MRCRVGFTSSGRYPHGCRRWRRPGCRSGLPGVLARWCTLRYSTAALQDERLVEVIPHARAEVFSERSHLSTPHRPWMAHRVPGRGADLTACN
jgi:hypothetical protein